MGIIDGRSPWAIQPSKVVSTLKDVGTVIKDPSKIRVQASCSLQFLPWDVFCEKSLSEKVGGEVLAFAVQKVGEIVAVSKAVPAVIVEGKKVHARKQVGTAILFCVGYSGMAVVMTRK